MKAIICDVKLVRRACCGNDEAASFLAQWGDYVHAVDDLVDGDLKGPEGLLSTFARAITLYSHPFYLKNLGALRQVALNVTSEYADSVAWEKSAVAWQRQWADHHRHAGNNMVFAVACICGGYDHARAILPEFRSLVYHEHHDMDGKPI